MMMAVDRPSSASVLILTLVVLFSAMETVRDCRRLAPIVEAGEVLGAPNAKMKAQLGKGEPKLFTPWIALQDQELAKKE